MRWPTAICTLSHKRANAAYRWRWFFPAVMVRPPGRLMQGPSNGYWLGLTVRFEGVLFTLCPEPVTGHPSPAKKRERTRGSGDVTRCKEITRHDRTSAILFDHGHRLPQQPAAYWHSLREARRRCAGTLSPDARVRGVLPHGQRRKHRQGRQACRRVGCRTESLLRRHGPAV